MHQSKKCSDAEAFGCSSVITRCLTAGPQRWFLSKGRPRRRAAATHRRSARLRTSVGVRKPSEAARPGLDLGRVLRQRGSRAVAVCLENKQRNHQPQPKTGAERRRVSLLQICSCSAAFICHSRNHLGGISMVSAGPPVALQHIPDHLKAKPVPLTGPGRSR